MTLLLCAYNHKRFIGEALRGALAQTYHPLQIVVCDDASPDGTADSVAEVLAAYGGPHDVHFLRNETNIGLSATINRALPMIRGELVIGAAGDDVSLPQRVSVLADTYEASGGKARLVYSNAHVTDAAGTPQRILYPRLPDPKRHDLAWAAAEEFSIFGCTMAWHRDVFDTFGPLPDGLAMEDLVIPFRAAILGEIRYVDELLVKYREHDGNVYLGTAGGDMSVPQWQAALIKRAQLEQPGFRAVIADLKHATARFPERAREFARLESLTRTKLDRAVATEHVFGEVTLRAKLIASLGILHRSGLRRSSAQWLAKLFFPGLYLSRLRRANERITSEGLATYRGTTS